MGRSSAISVFDTTVVSTWKVPVSIPSLTVRSRFSESPHDHKPRSNPIQRSKNTIKLHHTEFSIWRPPSILLPPPLTAASLNSPTTPGLSGESKEGKKEVKRRCRHCRFPGSPSSREMKREEKRRPQASGFLLLLVRLVFFGFFLVSRLLGSRFLRL